MQDPKQRHFHGNVMCFLNKCDPGYILENCPPSNWFKKIDDHFMSKTEAAEFYAETPIFELEEIGPGVGAHIGDGVFLYRCRNCDDYYLSYGPTPRYWNIGPHERQTHGLDVPGLNTPATV